MQPMQENPIHTVVSLISNELVQGELQIAPPQLKAFKDAMLRLKASFMPKIQELRKTPDTHRREAFAELMNEMRVEVDAVFAELMQPRQLSRFQQIRLRYAGAAALHDATFRAELNLTAPQLSQIKPILEDGLMRISVAQRVPGQSASKTNTVVMKKISTMLTEEQQGLWREKLGEPLSFDILDNINAGDNSQAMENASTAVEQPHANESAA